MIGRDNTSPSTKCGRTLCKQKPPLLTLPRRKSGQRAGLLGSRRAVREEMAFCHLFYLPDRGTREVMHDTVKRIQKRS
jgi:hypothetical protein